MAQRGKTLDQVIIEGLSEVPGVEAHLVDQPKAFYVAIEKDNKPAGRVWWDVVEFDFSINYVLVKLWFDDVNGKTIVTDSADYVEDRFIPNMIESLKNM